MGATRAGRLAGGRDLRDRTTGHGALPLPAGRGEVPEGLLDLEPNGLPQDTRTARAGRGVRPDRSGPAIRSRPGHGAIEVRLAISLPGCALRARRPGSGARPRARRTSASGHLKPVTASHVKLRRIEPWPS